MRGTQCESMQRKTNLQLIRASGMWGDAIPLLLLLVGAKFLTKHWSCSRDTSC